MADEYLLEVRSQEMPPDLLRPAIRQLATRLFEDLMGRGLGPREIVTGATPRRLTVAVLDLPDREPGAAVLFAHCFTCTKNIKAERKAMAREDEAFAALKAEQLGYQKQMAASMRDRQTAEAQIAGAQSDKVAAEIRLIERKIDQAALIAPITGWVVSEDLKQQIGAPVETGKILFEIASIDSLRAELYVPESSIANVAAGQTGELAAVGHPDQKVRFVIERITPIAEVVNHQNVFDVRARILEHLEWMRPGMEGEARMASSRIWFGVVCSNGCSSTAETQQSRITVANQRLMPLLSLGRQPCIADQSND